jgi:hypothetical protein
MEGKVIRLIRATRTFLVAACIGLLASGANAQTVCYFTDFNAGTTAPAGPITANGFTAVQIADIAAFDFTGCDIVMINESSNDFYSAALLSRVADLAAYVNAGGSLVFHDRFVTGANTLLPGAAATVFVRDFGDDANIDIVTGGTLLTNGPFGVITNATLDNGNSSSHGFATAATLPAGAVNLLSRTNAAESVAFVYQFGLGFVYYSTSPLDFYLAGNGNNPPRDNFNNIYAPNVLAYEHSLQAGAVPEPGALAMLAGLGLSGVLALRRRRA